MGITIKDAQLVAQVTGNEKIPVSDGSGEPRAVTTEQIKEYIGNGGDDNVQSDWNETDPASDAYIKNKPTIYPKPSAGIPKSDLARDVQSSLDKADTALQEHQDISGLATKSELNNKQDTLVSGTNIKTINGKNILGEGNIVIEGGGSVDLTGYATEDWVKDEIKGKQDTISDLQSIRKGSELGMTALQEEQFKGTISAVNTNESVDEPEMDYVTKSELEDALTKAIYQKLNTEV